MNTQNRNETNAAIDLRRFKGMKVEKVLFNIIPDDWAVLILSEQRNEKYVIKMYEMQWNETHKRYFPTIKIASFTLPSKMKKDRFDAYLAPITTMQSLITPQTV